MMAETIIRPNGKPYHPRTVTCHAWEDDSRLFYRDDNTCGAVVLGTHDIEEAHKLAEYACRYWYGMHASNPQPGWYRDGFQHGERRWIHDPERGRAGVMFSANEEVGPDEESE